MSVLGVDVGGTSTEVCLYDHAMVHRVSVPTDTQGGDAVRATVIRAVAQALDDTGRSFEEVSSIGVGIPGHVELASGMVRHAVNLGINGTPYPIGPSLRKELGVLVVVDNDLRVAALGALAHYRPEVPGLRDLVYLGLGTGVGAGVIIDGAVYRGRRGLAGEIGHVPPANGNEPCACGSTGCLEASLGGPALLRRWPAGIADLFARAAEGGDDATRLADEIVDRLAATVRLVATAYDPELVVVGGGVALAHPDIPVRLDAALRSAAARSELAGALIEPDRVRTAPRDISLALLGAALLAKNEETTSAKRRQPREENQ